ncbi:MAG: glycosyltransferase [Pseudomonadota bacterium]
MDTVLAKTGSEIALRDPELDKPRVLIIVRSFDGDPAGQSAFDVASHLAAQGVVSQVLSGGGRQIKSLLRRKVTHVQWDVPGDGPLGRLRATSRITRLIRDNNINIVHVFGRVVPAAVRSACTKTGAKMVVTVPGTYPVKGGREARRTRLLARADHFIAPSTYVQNYLVDTLAAAPGSITQIAPGIDMAHFNPAGVKGMRMIELARQQGIPEDHRIALMPARLIWWKGQRGVIEAFGRLSEPNATLLIAGDSSLDPNYANDLEAQVEAAGMEAQVRFLDVVPDMPALYMLSDVVIEAPIQPVAFARTSVEAQAMGRPVVTSAVGSGPEAIIEDETGWLAAPDDVDSIAAALKEALNITAEGRKHLAFKARAHARAHFDMADAMAATEAVYSDLLDL